MIDNLNVRQVIVLRNFVLLCPVICCLPHVVHYRFALLVCFAFVGQGAVAGLLLPMLHSFSIKKAGRVTGKTRAPAPRCQGLVD
jgi:hypothetical protein